MVFLHFQLLLFPKNISVKSENQIFLFRQTGCDSENFLPVAVAYDEYRNVSIFSARP
jgi:hypothetical protein